MAKSVEIPQDIIDNVIAAVGYDTHLLKQCSLVSSTFLRSSRKHLFSRITLSSDETCDRILQFLVQNPDIQSFVRAITLTESLPKWCYVPDWINCPSLLAILRLTFCCLECFSIILREPEDECDGYSEPWDWDYFSDEMEDALSNITLSPSLKTLCLNGIINVPTTFFLHIAHLTTLELHSLAPNDFCDENYSSLTRAVSNGVASHTVIDRCVWRFGGEHARQSIALIFLPFMCRLRFLEIYLDFSSGTRRDFHVLSFLIGSLSISLTSPEHLQFNIQFHGYNEFDPNTFYVNLSSVWSPLDSITTDHDPSSSRLQRVEININYAPCGGRRDRGAEPDMGEILKAVHDGLPLLHTKGNLFVEAVLEK